MSWKRGTRPAKIDKDKIVELHKQGLRQVDIARELGCSQCYITHVLDSRKVKRLGKKGGANPKARENAQKVLDSIVENGGTLREALMRMNLNVCDATVRVLAKEQGIDIQSYRYFKQRRSNWEVHKAGYRKENTHHNILPVRCTECGHEAELHYLQFSSAHPMTCPSCGAR